MFCQLIDNYEDKYVPELTELFPELVEETPIEITDENSKPPRYASELSDSELAAQCVFFYWLSAWGRQSDRKMPSLLMIRQLN